MICVDNRAGSKNLLPLFPKDMTLSLELPAADILFTGKEDEFMTAIEHKQIMDLLQCMVTGRFAGTQLPAMLEVYEDNWLLVEGPMRQGPRGELQVESGRGHWYQAHFGSRFFNWSDLETWMITMQTLTPLKIKMTQSRLESRDWLLLLYDWWRRGKDRHKSHMVTDKSRAVASLSKASLLRRIAEQLPGIGFDKALSVEAHFGDVFEMVVADESEWIKIEGIGVKMASRIVAAIKNGG